MTLTVRKIFLTVGAVLGLLFFLLFAYGLYHFLVQTADSPGRPVSASLLWSLAGIGSTALFSVVGGFGFRRLFRRTSSLEIFFFLTFIVTLSFDGLRILNLLFIMENLSPYYGTFVTRIIYFGYFLGLISLFASSLYSGNEQYQKMGMVVGLILLFSLALAYTLPVDSTVFHRSLLYRVGGEQYILLVRIGLEILALIGFGRSAFLSGAREQWIICGSIGMVIIGRELLFFLYSPLLIGAGFLLLTGGTFLFSRKSYEKHLWI
jgi:hypothetical protein